MQFNCFYIFIFKYSEFRHTCVSISVPIRASGIFSYFSQDDFQEFNVKQALRKLSHWAYHIYIFFDHKKCKSSLTMLVLSHSRLMLNILTIMFSAAVRNTHTPALYFFQRCSSIELVLFSATIDAIKSCLIQFTSFLPSLFLFSSAFSSSMFLGGQIHGETWFLVQPPPGSLLLS